jgi:hypothetical protein
MKLTTIAGKLCMTAAEMEALGGEFPFNNGEQTRSKLGATFVCLKVAMRNHCNDLE